MLIDAVLVGSWFGINWIWLLSITIDCSWLPSIVAIDYNWLPTFYQLANGNDSNDSIIQMIRVIS